MKEFILVEFLFEAEHVGKCTAMVRDLGDDFQYLKSDIEWDSDNIDHDSKSWMRISGRINSATATAIRLQDPFFSERMKVSYIPEDLKDKYRTK